MYMSFLKNNVRLFMRKKYIVYRLVLKTNSHNSYEYNITSKNLHQHFKNPIECFIYYITYMKGNEK